MNYNSFYFDAYIYSYPDFKYYICVIYSAPISIKFYQDDRNLDYYHPYGCNLGERVFIDGVFQAHSTSLLNIDVLVRYSIPAGDTKFKLYRTIIAITIKGSNSIK